MKIKLALIFTVFWIVSCSSNSGNNQSDVEIQEEIENEGPVLPSIFNVNHFSISMNEKMTEIYTTTIDEHGDMHIDMAVKNGEAWSEFSPIDFTNDQYNDIDPFLSRDGKKLYFISNRDNEMFEGDDAIWVSEKENNNWGNPKLLSSNINFEGSEGFPSVAENGNIYFPMVDNGNRDIYISKFENGEYQTPVKLSEAINSAQSDSNPAISGDESILVFYSAREGGFGEADLYISYKENGEWLPAVNMGDKVNSELIEYCPYITHDNKYLFYTRWNREKEYRFMMRTDLLKLK